MMRTLVSVLHKEGHDAGIKKMKTTLLEAIDIRFEDIERNRVYAVATLLDPWFKSHFLKDAACTEAKAGVMLAAASFLASPNAAMPATNNNSASGTQSSTVEDDQLPMKISRVEESSSRLWDCFNKIV